MTAANPTHSSGVPLDGSGTRLDAAGGDSGDRGAARRIAGLPSLARCQANRGIKPGAGFLVCGFESGKEQVAWEQDPPTDALVRDVASPDLL